MVLADSLFKDADVLLQRSGSELEVVLSKHFVNLALGQFDFADSRPCDLVGDAGGSGLRHNELGEHVGVDKIQRFWL